MDSELLVRSVVLFIRVVGGSELWECVSGGGVSSGRVLLCWFRFDWIVIVVVSFVPVGSS